VKKSEWSDKHIEELLRQMPKIQDHRHPRDIYQNLSLKKRKSPTWLIPSIAAAAALLIFFILVPKLMNGPQFSYDRAGENKMSKGIKMDYSSRNNKESAIALKKQASTSKAKLNSGVATPELFQAGNLKTAVYADDVENGKVLTYWIPDKQAQMLIPVSTIAKDTKDKNWLTLFNEKMTSLTEEDWGLSDFYPVNAKLILDNKDNSILIDVPTNHVYGQGSSNETSFLNVMKKNVATNSNIRKLKFSTNSMAGINFGNMGEMKELKFALEKDHAYFFYYPKRSEIPFLVPSLETYKDIKAAFDAMGRDYPNTELKASLSLLHFNTASIKAKTLFLSLNPGSNLKNDKNTLHSFEALLLTAKEFGIEKVMVENAPLSYLGPFDLTKEINVPLAPNLRIIQ
jgi:hypothetical protein